MLSIIVHNLGHKNPDFQTYQLNVPFHHHNISELQITNKTWQKSKKKKKEKERKQLRR